MLLVVSFDAAFLEGALATLGELLETRGHAFEIVAIGGGSLLLLGLFSRPTKDVDVVALARSTLERADPLPPALRDAVKDVAAALNLAEDWLNPGPASLFDLGLPGGFRERLTVRRFGGLTIHIAGRVAFGVEDGDALLS